MVEGCTPDSQLGAAALGRGPACSPPVHPQPPPAFSLTLKVVVRVGQLVLVITPLVALQDGRAELSASRYGASGWCPPALHGNPPVHG